MYIHGKNINMERNTDMGTDSADIFMHMYVDMEVDIVIWHEHM